MNKFIYVSISNIRRGVIYSLVVTRFLVSFYVYIFWGVFLLRRDYVYCEEHANLLFIFVLRKWHLEALAHELITKYESNSVSPQVIFMGIVITAHEDTSHETKLFLLLLLLWWCYYVDSHVHILSKISFS